MTARFGCRLSARRSPRIDRKRRRGRIGCRERTRVVDTRVRGREWRHRGIYPDVGRLRRRTAHRGGRRHALIADGLTAVVPAVVALTHARRAVVEGARGPFHRGSVVTACAGWWGVGPRVRRASEDEHARGKPSASSPVRERHMDMSCRRCRRKTRRAEPERRYRASGWLLLRRAGSWTFAFGRRAGMRSRAFHEGVTSPTRRDCAPHPRERVLVHKRIRPRRAPTVAPRRLPRLEYCAVP
jgi:hypothetical protein